jgi:hypothetical protein
LIELVVILGFAAALLVGTQRVVRREPDQVIARLVVFGFVAKMAGTAAYYGVIRNVYGSGDVDVYVQVGRRLAGVIRSGRLPDEATETGTRFMEFVTGAVFAVTGSSERIGYVVFSVLAFLGAYLFLQAFRLAIPDGDHRRYAALVFLMPTMVFWPSTIGKEAWLVFTLGVASYGAARMLRAERWGLLLAGVGGAGIFAVRPHMAALFAVSFVAAFLLRLRDPTVKRNLVWWLMGLLAVGVAAGVAVVRFSDEMGRTDTEGTATERVVADTDEIFERTERLTRDGGSAFDSRPVRRPGDLVHALVTVPFRPFPTEAHNWQATLMSFEGLALLALMVFSLPRIARLPSLASRKPYVALASAYCLGFVVAFSNVGNFGILVRQRAQLLPFLLVLLALPLNGEKARSSEGRSPMRKRNRTPLVVIAPTEEGCVVPDAGEAGDSRTARDPRRR